SATVAVSWTKLKRRKGTGNGCSLALAEVVRPLFRLPWCRRIGRHWLLVDGTTHLRSELDRFREAWAVWGGRSLAASGGEREVPRVLVRERGRRAPSCRCRRGHEALSRLPNGRIPDGRRSRIRSGQKESGRQARTPDGYYKSCVPTPRSATRG